ncbi:MAG: hypothetical protein WAZ18_01135 [Alphaproteobacteria bacterium]
MAYETLKSNPLTYALGKAVMTVIRLARSVQNMLHKQPIPALLPFQKRQALLALGQAYNLQNFVETGTYLGETVEFMAPHFKRILSYELAPDLHAANVKKLKKHKHVELYLGDSGKLLPTHLTTLKTPTLFWLDGHFSGGPTAYGDLASPVLAELQALMAHPVKGHVIVIDDSRDFRGLEGYPTIRQLQWFINRHPGYMLRLKDDLLVIAPSE